MGRGSPAALTSPSRLPGRQQGSVVHVPGLVLQPGSGAWEVISREQDFCVSDTCFLNVLFPQVSEDSSRSQLCRRHPAPGARRSTPPPQLGPPLRLQAAGGLHHSTIAFSLRLAAGSPDTSTSLFSPPQWAGCGSQRSMAWQLAPCPGTPFPESPCTPRTRPQASQNPLALTLGCHPWSGATTLATTSCRCPEKVPRAGVDGGQAARVGTKAGVPTHSQGRASQGAWLP